jgi:urease accessory protein
MEKFINVETQSVWASIAAESTSLVFRLREKARQRIVLDSGEHVALMLPRGTVLRNGDVIVSRSGRLLKVFAAPEPVSTVLESDIRQITRIAWHLGNRHVRLQVGESWVRYQSDHVLDEMVRRLGSNARCHLAPFEPEPGAYHDHGSLEQDHSHSPADGHDVHRH